METPTTPRLLSKGIAPVRCPKPCGKVLAEQLTGGTLTVTCRHCKRRVTFDGVTGKARIVNEAPIAA